MNNKNISRSLCCALLALCALGAWAPAQAIPAFARQFNKPCSTCHAAFPRLNEAGRTFRANGYRFLEEPGGKEVWDMASLPIAAEVEVEAFLDQATDSTGTSLPDTSDVKIEAVELLLGTAMGETGRVSVFAALELHQEDEAGETVYVSEIGPAFIQINDLLGGQGLGRLNLRAGQFDLSLPFLSPEQSVIHNDYFAQAIGVLGDGARRALEFNGQITAGSGGGSVVHRYAVGVARTAFNGDPDRNSKLDPYASYAINIAENYNLGAIWKSDREEGATPDVSQTVERYGIAGNVVFGPAEVTLGYFVADPDIGSKYDDVLGEALFYVGKKAVFGARYEQLSAEGAADDATMFTITARYNVLQNLSTVLEYRNLDDNSNIISDNIKEEEYVLNLQLLF